MGLRTALRRPGGKGAMAGGLLGLAVMGLGLSGWGEVEAVVEAVRLLAAIPPFFFDPVLQAPEWVHAPLVIAWWAAVGGLVAALAEKGFFGQAATAVLILSLTVAQLHTRNEIESSVDNALDAVKRMVEEHWPEDWTVKLPWKDGEVAPVPEGPEKP